MKATRISPKGIALLKKFEGFKAKPYKCPAGIPTIGYGSTYYEDGTKVKLTDPPITEQRANKLLTDLLISFEKAVDSYMRDDITQNQFDALVVFAYNVGTNALKNSTLCKKVNKNPNDPTIRNEFMKWANSGGKKLVGLVKRRQEEANLYYEK